MDSFLKQRLRNNRHPGFLVASRYFTWLILGNFQIAILASWTVQFVYFYCISVETRSRWIDCGLKRLQRVSNIILLHLFAETMVRSKFLQIPIWISAVRPEKFSNGFSGGHLRLLKAFEVAIVYINICICIYNNGEFK